MRTLPLQQKITLVKQINLITIWRFSITLTKSKYNTRSLARVLVGTFLKKHSVTMFSWFSLLFFLIISEAGIIPTAIYTSLPPHQLPFLVLRDFPRLALLLCAVTYREGSESLALVQNGFGARGQRKTRELLKLCSSPQKAQVGSRVYEDTGFLLCWVSGEFWA